MEGEAKTRDDVLSLLALAAKIITHDASIDAEERAAWMLNAARAGVRNLVREPTTFLCELDEHVRALRGYVSILVSLSIDPDLDDTHQTSFNRLAHDMSDRIKSIDALTEREPARAAA